MIEGELRFPADQLARLLRTESIGEPHPVLAPDQVWRPAAEERELDAAARAALAAAGTTDRRGRLDPELAATLAVLCHATTEYYGRLTEGPTHRAILVAAIGGEAVLATREPDNTIVLRQARADLLPETVAAQTPDTHPAAAEHLTLHHSDLAAATVVEDEASPLRPPPVNPDLRLARTLAALPATAAGQLHAAHRDAMGRRSVSPAPVGYLDTERGRFINAPLPGPEPRTLFAPGDRATLAKHLDDLYLRLL